jgi:hypothetical protein
MYSEKLKELRVIVGFKFRFHRTMKNEIQRWACINKRCNVLLKCNTLTHGVEIENNLEHNNHAADEKQSHVSCVTEYRLFQIKFCQKIHKTYEDK